MEINVVYSSWQGLMKVIESTYKPAKVIFEPVGISLRDLADLFQPYISAISTYIWELLKNGSKTRGLKENQNICLFPLSKGGPRELQTSQPNE